MLKPCVQRMRRHPKPLGDLADCKQPFHDTAFPPHGLRCDDPLYNGHAVSTKAGLMRKAYTAIPFAAPSPSSPLDEGGYGIETRVWHTDRQEANRRQAGQEKPMPNQPTPDVGSQRTYMRATYHISLTQQAMQINWSLYHTKRHRAYSTVPPPNAHLVRWTNQITVICKRCGHILGAVVVFYTDDLYGVVEDTARWAEFGRCNPNEITTGFINGKPRWMYVTGSERNAQVHLRCKRCKRNLQPRNAHRMGLQIVRDKRARVILE